MKTNSNEHLDTRGGGGAPIRNPDNGQLMVTVSGRLANDDMVSDLMNLYVLNVKYSFCSVF